MGKDSYKDLCPNRNKLNYCYLLNRDCPFKDISNCEDWIIYTINKKQEVIFIPKNKLEIKVTE